MASPGPPRWVRANRCDAEQLHGQQSGLPRRCVPGAPGLRARAHSEAAGMIPGLGTSLGREAPCGPFSLDEAAEPSCNGS